MSLQDTIKSIEEADEKLKKAIALELSAIALQKGAAKLRDEAQHKLDKTLVERTNLDALQVTLDAESERRESGLNNREVALSAGKADLERNTIKNNKTFDIQNAELDTRTVALDNAARRNKEFEETLNKRAEKYKSIGEFITTTL